MKKLLLLFILLALPSFGGREFLVSSNRHGVATISPISPPITLFAWATPNQTNDASVVVSVNASTNATELVQLIARQSVAGDPWAGSVVNSAGASTTWNSSVTATSGTMAAVAIVFASSTSRTIYVNGAATGTDTTAITADGLDVVGLGIRKLTTWTLPWGGLLAEVAVWDVALTSSELSSLSSGAAPFMIRPANLKFYAPLTGRETTSEWNLVGAAVSLTNSPAVSALHPRIYLP